jgi:hypothetical protein
MERMVHRYANEDTPQLAASSTSLSHACSARETHRNRIRRRDRYRWARAHYAEHYAAEQEDR